MNLYACFLGGEFLDLDLYMKFLKFRLSMLAFPESFSTSTPDQIKESKRVPHASALGSIMYSMLCTRPNTAYVVGVTSRYRSNLRKTHWKDVKDILKYLRRTKDLFIVYMGSDLKIEGFTDSVQSDMDDQSWRQDLDSGWMVASCNGRIPRKAWKWIAPSKLSIMKNPKMQKKSFEYGTLSNSWVLSQC